MKAVLLVAGDGRLARCEDAAFKATAMGGGRVGYNYYTKRMSMMAEVPRARAIFR